MPTTIDLYTSKTVHRRLPVAFQEGVAQSTAITIHPLSTTANMGANNALGSCNESGKVLQLGQQPGSKAMSAGADAASRAVDTETSHRPPLQMAAARNVKSQQANSPTHACRRANASIVCSFRLEGMSTTPECKVTARRSVSALENAEQSKRLSGLRHPGLRHECSSSHHHW